MSGSSQAYVLCKCFRPVVHVSCRAYYSVLHRQLPNPGLAMPHPGIFTRCESRGIGNLLLPKSLLALPSLEGIVDGVCPLAFGKAKVSVGDVCKILVMHRHSLPRPLYRAESWDDAVWRRYCVSDSYVASRAPLGP